MTTQINDWPSPDELEAWARQPIAEIQAAEQRAYGRVLSTARAQRDTPYFRSKRSPKLTRPTKRDVADQEAAQPAWPEGAPDPRWADAELDAYIQTQDQHIAAQPAPERPLRWEELSDSQLDALSAEQPPAPTKRKIRVRR